MATNAGNVAPYRRATDRKARDWQPRLSAVEIVGNGGVCGACGGSGESRTHEGPKRPCETCAGSGEGRWTLRLTDRATCLELALLRLAYGAELAGEDSRGMILQPRRGTTMPTREELVETLRAIHERRPPNRGR